MQYRLPEPTHWPEQYVDRIIHADARKALRELPDECVALAITSPPYWNIVDYGVEGQIGHTSYDVYLDDLMTVWRETERILIPNGKLAIVTPIMPIPKSKIGDQHTRHLKNLAFDIEARILQEMTGLYRFGLMVWKKQTTTKMFGSYPYPPNIYEDNTIEFINVYVKSGVPPTISKKAKEPSHLAQAEWRNLTMQVWPMYPEDVKRTGGHPAPFPVVLPQRLIYMYSFQQASEAGFAGDIVLDMFNGSGATTLAAKVTGRRWIGIDLNPDYCKHAQSRLSQSYTVNSRSILLDDITVRRARDSSQLGLFSSAGQTSAAPHRRKDI